MLSLSSCALVRTAAFNYHTTKLPAAQVVSNIKYSSASQTDPDKNRLDLFLPSGKNWPTLVFVHGGEWISGDRAFKVMGADIYSNIGRYFASQGIGVAVISYRLLPENNWKSQIMDVARALHWVHLHIKEYHGNPKNIFLSGHSSGAQLAVRVALDPTSLQSLQMTPQIICGVISISGAGFNLSDEETYQAAKKENLFEKLFHTDDISPQLRRQFSPQRFANASAPPFLILYADKEEKALKDGSVALHERLVKAGVNSQLVKVPQKNHGTIVLSLSQPEQISTTSMLVFMKSMTCSS